jgi:hypothetical protein
MHLKPKTKRTIVMHTTSTYTCRIPTHEAIEAMKELSDVAYKLLIYYYSKSTGWNFDDTVMADALGVTPRTISERRNELIDKGYLMIEKGKNIDNYFVGKKAVMDWKYPEGEPSEA